MAEEGGAKSPIIIKKINKGAHGHHGGAWKIAYADFVTARWHSSCCCGC